MGRSKKPDQMILFDAFGDAAPPGQTDGPPPLDVEAHEDAALELAHAPRAVQRQRAGALLWALALACTYGADPKNALGALTQLRKFSRLDYDPVLDAEGVKAAETMTLSEQINEIADHLPEILAQLPDVQRAKILTALRRGEKFAAEEEP